uniref:Uncharacterized protein n=1 Tax=Trichogramma kaykai TaxID=54128 RepID=A0ABD2XF07_9HYME
MFHVPKELKALKIMHGNVNWKIQKERRKFLNQVYFLIGNWKGPFPNLRHIFSTEEIESLLIESLKNLKAEILIEFLINTGYEDEPVHDARGKPQLRRTTPLHYAAKRETRYNVINELFKIYNKFDVNYTDETGLSHFHVACMTGCEYAVEKFLEFGIDPNFRSNSKSPLQIALSEKHQHIVRLLIKRGADPNSADADGLTHLHIICKEPGNYDLARIFFEICDEVNKTVPVNAQDKFGNTPLLFALQFMGYQEQEMTKMLLRRGANLNLVNKNGLMTFHIICQKEWAYTLVKFIDNHHPPLQVNARDQFGNTPLHIALNHHCTKLARLLLKRGADPNLTNAKGLTALQIICTKNCDSYDVMKLFEINKKAKRPIQVNKQDSFGNTALHFALHQRNNKMVVRLLLEKGANPNLANAEGSTALHYRSTPETVRVGLRFS